MAKIEDGSNSTSEADVSLGRLIVSPPGYNADGTVFGGGPSAAGAISSFHENDPGTITGVKDIKSPEVSPDYRQRVAIDTLLLSETFNANAQNTTNWNYVFNTLTASLPGTGFLTFSTVQGTTGSHGAFLRTSQYFPLLGAAAPVYFEFIGGQQIAAMVANEVFLAGFGLPTAATTPPAEGAYFRITSAGVIGEINFNGSPTQTGVLAPLSDLVLGSNYKFCITLSKREVVFWINDVKYGSLAMPAGQGQPFLTNSLPVFFMKYNTGVVSNTNKWGISEVVVSQGDLNTNKPWAHQLVDGGQGSFVGQNGHAQAGTAGYANGAIPATSGGSNTTSNVSGIGGVGQMTAQVSNAGAAGDMIASSFLNYAPTINITGRNLFITGVRISAINNGAAVATTPTTLLWGIAFGHTALSLATVETGSFVTATTRSPRRVPLGFMTVPVGAAVGATYDKDIVHQFQSPIVVRPGEYIATVVRFIVGTATASQTVLYSVMFEGFWE